MQHRPTLTFPSRLLAGLGVVLMAAACGDIQEPTSAVPRAPSISTAVVPASVDAELQRVARAVALALGDAPVRLSLRDALRDSPWDEHQLLLQELVAAPEGRLLAAAAARAAGQTAEQFATRVAALPPLDLIMPSREHRTTWRGTPGVLVTATLNSESGPVHRFDLRGDAVRSAGAGVPVLRLSPAEPRAKRYRPERGRGETIQGGREEQAVTFTWLEPNGDSIVVSLEDVMAGRDPRFRVIASAADGPTNLRYVKVRFDDAGDDLELVLDAKFYRPDGGLIGTARWSDYSFPPNGDESPNVPLIQKIVPNNSTARINVHVWEDDCDCFGNNDDHYGSRDFDWDDNEITQTIYDGGWGASDVRLGWTAIAAPTFSGVQVYGDDIYLDDVGVISATAVDQYGWPLGGYSVSSWSSDHPGIASIYSTASNTAYVQGNDLGTATVRATINGVTGIGYVNVEAPWNSGCSDPTVLFC